METAASCDSPKRGFNVDPAEHQFLAQTSVHEKWLERNYWNLWEAVLDHLKIDYSVSHDTKQAVRAWPSTGGVSIHGGPIGNEHPKQNRPLYELDGHFLGRPISNRWPLSHYAA